MIMRRCPFIGQCKTHDPQSLSALPCPSSRRQVVYANVYGAILFHEDLTLLQASGGVLIGLGIVQVNRDKEHGAQRAAPAEPAYAPVSSAETSENLSELELQAHNSTPRQLVGALKSSSPPWP